jgi:disulfide bond formation protein DsbB
MMNPLVEPVTTLLSLGTLVMQVVALLLLLSLLLKKEDLKKRKGLGAFVGFISDYILEIGFLVSVGAILSSLFYSSIAGYAPCEFCWWQRIMIYPQAVLFGVALYYSKAKKVAQHAVALSTSLILTGVGLALALFQTYGTRFDPSLLDACVANGVSCSKQYFVSFGYIDIPMMSLTCFALLVLVVLVHRRFVKAQ